MKPVAILSCDTNPDYLFCLPIVAKSWELQGIFPATFVFGDDVPKKLLNKYLPGGIACLQNIYFTKSSNKALYSQCMRLYIWLGLPEDIYYIIGDADMFIASDFLYRDGDKVNVFGHDLTGFNEIPMCYIGAPVDKWKEIMNSTNVAADIEKYSKYDSDVWHEAWGADQQIITAKLKEYGYDKINFINRGTDPNNLNLPLGRWDRYGGFKRPAGQIHDVHLPREPYSEESFPKIVAMCKDVYPNESWDWLEEYRNEFLKTINI